MSNTSDLHSGLYLIAKGLEMLEDSGFSVDIEEIQVKEADGTFAGMVDSIRVQNQPVYWRYEVSLKRTGMTIEKE